MQNMRAVALVPFVVVSVLALASSAHAGPILTFGFETAWAGDYAPGWENTQYRHGTAPVAQMMRQTTTAHSGAAGLELSASDPLGLFWVGVNPTGIPASYLDRQYDPYFSAWYYEENTRAVAGQIFAVPDSPIADVDDWTDVQFGGRRQPASGANFYQIAAEADGSAQWVDTTKARTGGWHHLKMQLSSADGKIYFTLDGVGVGATTRNDYTNLGIVGLYTMFDAASLGTSGAGSSTIWDDVEFGSTAVPEPAALGLLGLGLAAIARRARRNREAN